MENNLTIQTDGRLVGILESGRYFLRMKDPEGLLREATPIRLVLDYGTGKWGMMLVFPSGAVINLTGTIRDGEYNVSGIGFPQKGSVWEAEGLGNAAKTLVSAIGNLSKVPARLKPYLSRETKRDANARILETNPTPILKNAWDALFYRVEGRTSEKAKTAFQKIRFDYKTSEGGEIIKTEISTSCKTETGFITVYVETDIYGIGNKKVVLTKSLGQGRTATINCWGNDKGKIVPSLKVAFDLDERIPYLYHPEKRKKISTGKPKAAPAGKQG